MNMTGNSSYDAIIVLGGGILPDGALSPISKNRLDYALALFEREAVPLVVTGKWSLLLEAPPPRTEAEAMREYVLARGTVTADDILLEDQSMETIGNAYYLKVGILAPRAWHKVLAVTSEFHVPRAEQTFVKVFSQAYTIDFVAAPSGLQGPELAAKERVEAVLSDFTTKLLTPVPDGDNYAVLAALQQLPGYGGAKPAYTRAELRDMVLAEPLAPDTYALE